MEKLLQDIRNNGVDIACVDDLIKISIQHRKLIPLIIGCIQSVDSERDKEFLVRCLGVKGFYEASRPLVNEFYRSNSILLKWAIGNTLSIIKDPDILPDLIKIAQNKEHGIARQMIVDGLGFYKTDDVKNVLVELLTDDDVTGHAISAIRKIGDKELARHIEPFMDHEKTWIRNEAIKTVKKLRI